MSTASAIAGTVHPKFEKVRERFERNLRDEGEVGASFSVVLDGETVVDLYGGHADRARTRPWAEDTLVNVYSTTKGLAALCVAMLADRGELDYAAPVAGVWPEFAQAGKDQVTIETLLSHQAGVCGFREPTVTRDYYDHDAVARRLAALEPFWKPGTANGYHAISFGFLAGELVRRASGRTLGQFLADEVSGPLRADAYIGLPESEDGRVAEIIAPAAPPETGMAPPSDVLEAAVANPALDPEVPNTRAWRAAEIPAANGQANARGLARIYGALARGGELGGVRLLSEAGLARATAERCCREDLVLGFSVRWSAGFILNTAPLYGPNAESYGHSGWGGSLAFADPTRRLGAAYAMNQMGANLQGDRRGLGLIEAVYESL